jgi:hypothetical protein
MPDSFIVNITNARGSFEADMEIPSFMTFSELKDKLLEILKILDEDEFRSWQDFRLYYRNRAIGDDESLARAGAFDGSRLIAALE